MTHTPTPWEIVSRLVGPLVIVSGDTEVAHVGADSFELASANAAHIVKCVNVHNELVAALVDIERSLNFSTNGGKSRNKFECELLKVAQAALRKASEEA